MAALLSTSVELKRHCNRHLRSPEDALDYGQALSGLIKRKGRFELFILDVKLLTFFLDGAYSAKGLEFKRYPGYQSPLTILQSLRTACNCVDIARCTSFVPDVCGTQNRLCNMNDTSVESWNLLQCYGEFYNSFFTHYMFGWFPDIIVH